MKSEDGSRESTGAVRSTISLTPREKQVYNALTDVAESPGVIASRADIRTISPRETAATFCRKLTRRGLAIKGGTPMCPKWRRAPIER